MGRAEPTARGAKDAGALLGKFRVLGHLGRGGMADVLVAVATDAVAPKMVALKLLRDHLADEPEWVTNFLDEARVSLQLSHRNIVQTYEVGDVDGHQAIVLEFLEGASLSELRRSALTRDGVMPLDVGLYILSEALNGLDYAHQKLSIDGQPLELVHRDFTPNNITATLDGQVKVLDFGIAKTAETSARTSTGVVKGTVRFVAPEAILGRVVDRRVDIYAAGIALWELVTGQRVWQGLVDVAILARVSTGGTPALREVAPDAPDALVAICDRAVAFRAEERFATAGEMRDAIRAYMRGAGLTCDAEKLGAFVDRCVGAQCRERKRELEEALRSGRETPRKLLPVVPASGSGTSDVGSTTLQVPSESTKAAAFATSVSTRSDLRDVGAANRKAKRRSRGLLVGVIGALVCASALVYELGRRSTASAVAVPAPAIGDGAPPAASTAQVKVRLVPALAVVVVDGDPVSHAPGELLLARPVGSQAVLRVTAEGYDTTELRVRFDADRDELVSLSASRTARQDSPDAAGQPTATPTASPRVTPRAPRPGDATPLPRGADRPRRIDESNPFDE